MRGRLFLAAACLLIAGATTTVARAAQEPASAPPAVPVAPPASTLPPASTAPASAAPASPAPGATAAPGAAGAPAAQREQIPVTGAPSAPGPPAPGPQRPALSPTAIDALLGRRVVSVSLRRLGQVVNDPRLLGLLETRPGAPLSMREVRDSVLHLFNTGLFRDVDVVAEPAGTGSAGAVAPSAVAPSAAAPSAAAPGAAAPGAAAPGEAGGAAGDGVALVYQLTPARTVTRYDFRGELGVSESDLRRLLVDRFGARPPLGRAQAAVAALEAYYKDAGYLNARVSSTTESIATETVSLVMTIAAGARARIGRIDLTGPDRTPLDPAGRGPSSSSSATAGDLSPAHVQSRLGLSPGEPFDGPDLQRRVARFQLELRNRGHYEASITPTQTPREEGQLIDVAIAIDPGPRVSLRIEGTSIPTSRLEELVPVKREGSIDEDLLEDSKRRIEQYLHGRGHRYAEASYARVATPAGLDLVFTVREGPIVRVAEVRVSGERAMTRAEIDTLLGLGPGALLVESDVDTKAIALRERYRRQGFRLVNIVRDIEIRDTPPPAAAVKAASTGRDGEAAAWVDISLAITEGPQTRVGTIAIAGNTAVDESALRGALGLKPAAPFYEPQIAGDREAIQVLYLDRGFDRVQVEVTPTYSTDATRADLTFAIHEGGQQVVDRVLIVGNRRTDSTTIEKALTIKTGEPLGLSTLYESQRRLSALGLFRRVRITDVGEPGEPRRDVIVQVDEAPTTTVGYGAGVEAERRPTNRPDGSVGEKVDFAARGFFEVSRRNLFGSNRSATLFMRGSLRPRDRIDPGDSGFGFNEYRVLATLRDPDIFNTTMDAQVSGYFEQAVRTSFNFRRRGIQANLARRIAGRFTLVGGYSFNRTELFDDRISDEERPDIDRLFPQVRLSIFSAAARRDTRDDVIDPTRGTVLGLDSDVAVRALGSEVGFVKGFGEMYWYRQVPSLRRAVLATGVRVGLAKGFRRVVPLVIDGAPTFGPDGQALSAVISDLPASERFFAGGDTTVRGYARDTLGDPSTISNGFPRGGNAMIVLNSELRVPLWGDVGSALFVDAGNVFNRVSDVDFGRLRPTAGVGIRYKSPIGPIRVDFGFKLDRGRFETPTQRESLWEFHISIGQAY